MLTAYRRHIIHCSAGRPKNDSSYIKCKCPVWVRGTLNKVEIRESLKTASWPDAQRLIRDAEGRGYWKDPATASTTVKTLAQATESFLADCLNVNGRNLREGSIRNYTSVFRSFVAFCGEHTQIGTIDPEKIRAFRDTWHMSARSAAGVMCKIRALFRFCLDSEWIERNPAMSVRVAREKGSPRQKQPFTDAEVERILAVTAKDPHLDAIVRLMVTTGLRISDATMFNASQIDGDVIGIKTIKSGSFVCQPLHPETSAALAKITPDDKGRYFAISGSLRLNTQTDYWRRRIKDAYKDAGVHGTVHALRHTAAVRFLLAGLSTESVAKLLGHSSPQVTSRFYSAWCKSRVDALQDEVRTLWDKAA